MSFALTPPPHTPPASQALNPGTLGHLKFCEAGLVALRSYLGDGEIYRLFKARFDAADAAWLVSGSHTDGTHEVNPSSFHPSWTDFRPTHAKDKREAWQIRHDQREKLKSVIFDAITALDRITGGASLLIQFDGTVRPQQAIELSALKFDVYFPPHLLQENPGLDRVIARIVQEFAEHVGLPTAERWLLAFKKTGLGKLERETSPPEPVGGHFPPRPYLPPPQTNSSRFECFGCVKGELDAMDKVTPPPGFTVDRDGPSRRSGLAVASSATATPTPKLLQTLNEDNDVLRYELDTLREDYTALQDENDTIREENNILRGRVKDMEALLEDRDKTITGLREGAANTAMTTTTSSKSRVHDTDTSGMAGLSAHMLHVRAPAAPVPKTPVQFRVSPTPTTTPSSTAATGRASKSTCGLQ